MKFWLLSFRREGHSASLGCWWGKPSPGSRPWQSVAGMGCARSTSLITQGLWPTQHFPPPALTSVLPGTDLDDCFPAILPPWPTPSTVGKLYVRVKSRLRTELIKLKRGSLAAASLCINGSYFSQWKRASTK